MPKPLDLTGQVFGRLTVLKEDKHIRNPNGKSVRTWKCRCTCGKIITVRQNSLTGGRTHSCGCYKIEKITALGKQPTKIKDLTGQRFGKLVAVKPTENRLSGSVIWECECDCGNIAYIASGHLITGATKSCGCLISQGEELISKILRQLDIPFCQQKTFNTCRYPWSNRMAKFDFYINDLILLEYDGAQHFYSSEKGMYKPEIVKQIQDRDEYKTQWCKNNNIPLIRIPYTDFNKINTNYMKQLLQPYMEVTNNE